MYATQDVNALVVLTAGVDDKRHDLPLSTLVSKLQKLFNPNRSIEIVVIMFGTQGDFAGLNEIAKATDGVAYEISNPAEVGAIFIKGMTHRICSQGCTPP